jgi:1-acyl-sn-glycerol-3-phosphate acyltransferase
VFRLQQGFWPLVFPEGTRVAPGETGTYQVGGAWVACKAGVPVLPVPCNYESARMRGRKVHVFGVPNATNLLVFEVWMHEIIGWWAYRLRGWI